MNTRSSPSAAISASAIETKLNTGTVVVDTEESRSARTNGRPDANPEILPPWATIVASGAYGVNLAEKPLYVSVELASQFVKSFPEFDRNLHRN
jgi:hypothetical protein